MPQIENDFTKRKTVHLFRGMMHLNENSTLGVQFERCCLLLDSQSIIGYFRHLFYFICCLDTLLLETNVHDAVQQLILLKQFH